MRGSCWFAAAYTNACLLSVSGCLRPQTIMPSSPRLTVDSITEIFRQRKVAGNSGNVQAWVDCFSDDAVIMAANAPSIVGKRAIEKWERGFESFRPRVQVNIDELVIRGDWAYVRSSITGEFRGQGERFPIDGKELAILRRVDGQWKFHRICGNKNAGSRFEEHGK